MLSHLAIRRGEGRAYMVSKGGVHIVGDNCSAAAGNG